MPSSNKKSQIHTEKNATYMNPKQLKHFLGLLKAWLQQLEDETQQVLSEIKDEETHCPDMIDRANAEEQLSLEILTNQRDSRVIDRIKLSISDIEQSLNDPSHHSYGYCKRCKNEIGIERLEARLIANLCIECKKYQEVIEEQTQT